jgi:hypothetical protein
MVEKRKGGSAVKSCVLIQGWDAADASPYRKVKSEVAAEARAQLL